MSKFLRRRQNLKSRRKVIVTKDSFDAVGGLKIHDLNLTNLRAWDGPGANGTGVEMKERELKRVEQVMRDWAFNNLASQKVTMDQLL